MYARFLKPTISCFSFQFYVLHLTIWNFIIVNLNGAKNNLQWSCFSTFKWERPLMEKLKFKHLDGMAGMLLFFGILKVRSFVYVRMNFILKIMAE